MLKKQETDETNRNHNNGKEVEVGGLGGVRWQEKFIEYVVWAVRMWIVEDVLFLSCNLLLMF